MTALAPGIGAGSLSAGELLGRFSADSPPASAAGAAVLIVLREEDEDVETLLLQRTLRPSDPASGQVSLPGGHVHATDRSLADTALREFEEEVGLRASDLAVPPRFVAIEDAPRFGMRVGVFASRLEASRSHAFAPSPEEVARLFWLSRTRLGTVSQVPQPTPLGLRNVDAVVFDQHVLWGFTLRVLRRFFA